MAETVGEFPVGAFIDPQNGNAPIDADEVRANDDALRAGFNNHDGAAPIHFQGSLLAARPGAGTAGRKWFASDTKQIFRDNGSTWDEIDYLNLTNGGTVAGATTFGGGLTSTAGARTFGATTFSGTITGTSATLSGSVSAAGATLTGALSGTSATFSGTVGAAGATLTGALSGTSATFSSTLNVTGNTVLGGTLALTGKMALGDVAGLLRWSRTGPESMQLVGDSNANANLTVLGLTALGAATVGTTLGVTGAATFSSTINGQTISSAANFTGTLATAGAINGQTISSAAAFTGTVGVAGNFAVATNKFTVTAASGNTAVAGTLGVTGAATFSSTINGQTISSAANFTGTITAAGAINGQTISSAAAFTGTMSVAGDFAVNTNKFTVAAASGDTVVGGALTVTGAMTFSSSLTVNSTITANQVQTLGGSTASLNSGQTADITVPTGVSLLTIQPTAASGNTVCCYIRHDGTNTVSVTFVARTDGGSGLNVTGISTTQVRLTNNLGQTAVLRYGFLRISQPGV
jgi:hypothetical protein